ncbi:MAG: hypothetical protein PHX38_09265 [Sulfuricella sp.]|nr:hypothetical protein [Sulfuricella sp.]
MNLLFWKKKKAADAGADKTQIAPAAEAEPVPAKPGWFGRLKGALGRKKPLPGAEKAEPSAGHGDRKHSADDGAQTAGKPAKPGLFARLKGLFPRAKREPEKRGEELKRHAGSRGKNSAEEPERPPMAVRSWKRPMLGLALLALFGGAGFAAWQWLLPAKPSTAHEEKPTAPETRKAQAPQPESVPADGEATPPQAGEAAFAAPMTGTAAPQQALDAAAPSEAATADAQPAGETASGQGEDVQAQLEALKKQNQEMQAQIEALKKQGAHPASAAYRPGRIPPKDGVLIINGKDSKASAQALKHVIEEMNGGPENPDTKKAGKASK